MYIWNINMKSFGELARKFSTTRHFRKWMENIIWLISSDNPRKRITKVLNKFYSSHFAAAAVTQCHFKWQRYIFHCHIFDHFPFPFSVPFSFANHSVSMAARVHGMHFKMSIQWMFYLWRCSGSKHQFMWVRYGDNGSWYFI